MERRYLIVPGHCARRASTSSTRSPIRRQPEPREGDRARGGGEAETGYVAPHTVHCGPDGIYMNALGAAGRQRARRHLHRSIPTTFEVEGRWEQDRGPQHLAYDFWWHLGHDTMITSEWGTPNMVKDGVNPELLLGGQVRPHSCTCWDLRKRRHVQELDLGAEQQMALELRPAHDPTRAYGFVGVVMSLKDLVVVDLALVSRAARTARASGRSRR